MHRYYVNRQAQTNGDHEVHKAGCDGEHPMPSKENQLYLGDFSHCKYAVIEAKKTYKQSNGCYWCCRDCHTS